MSDQHEEFGKIDEDMKDIKPKKQVAKKESRSTKVAFEFPEGTNSKDIEMAMKTVKDLTAEAVKTRSLMEESRANYEKDGHRRWRCKVESLRAGCKTFQLTISHPTTDKPVPVEGWCGRILEDGLTRYAINCLNHTHHWEMEEIIDINPKASLALTWKKVKRYHYRVEMYEEIENPKPVGKIGLADPTNPLYQMA